jgi:DNA mismatch repair protein MutS
MSLAEAEHLGKGPRQLELFNAPINTVVDRLKKLDISRMTPLDAINSLNELQASARQLED